MVVDDTMLRSDLDSCPEVEKHQQRIGYAVAMRIEEVNGEATGGQLRGSGRSGRD